MMMVFQEKPVEITADYTPRKQSEVSAGLDRININNDFPSRSLSILESLNPIPRLRKRSGKISFSPSNHRVKRRDSSRFLNSQKYKISEILKTGEGQRDREED